MFRALEKQSRYPNTPADLGLIHSQANKSEMVYLVPLAIMAFGQAWRRPGVLTALLPAPKLSPGGQPCSRGRWRVPCQSTFSTRREFPEKDVVRWSRPRQDDDAFFSQSGHGVTWVGGGAVSRPRRMHSTARARMDSSTRMDSRARTGVANLLAQFGSQGTNPMDLLYVRACVAEVYLQSE